MYNQNFMRAGVMTPSVSLSFYAQLLPLPKPLLLLPKPHPSPLPPNKNFGHRLDFAWTLFFKVCTISFEQPEASP